MKSVTAEPGWFTKQVFYLYVCNILILIYLGVERSELNPTKLHEKFFLRRKYPCGEMIRGKKICGENFMRRKIRRRNFKWQNWTRRKFHEAKICLLAERDLQLWFRDEPNSLFLPHILTLRCGTRFAVVF